MAKKEKIKKEKPEKNKDKDIKENENKEQNKEDKVSIKKTFRDTGIVLLLLVAVVGLLCYIYRDELKTGAVVENPVELTTEQKEEKVVNNFLALANQELIDYKSLDEGDYITGISSFQYVDGEAKFCAYADKVDGAHYLVMISIINDFKGEDDFVQKMIDFDLKDYGDYDITTYAFELSSDETVDAKFHDKMVGVLPMVDTTQPIRYAMYKNISADDTYISATYVGSDGKVYSMHQIIYNSVSDALTVSDSDKYTLTSRNSQMLYDILGSFIKDKEQQPEQPEEQNNESGEESQGEENNNTEEAGE